MLPLLMRKHEAVQLVFYASPLGNVLGHECYKFLAVLFLDHMQELVSDDIFHARKRFFHQLKI